MRFFLILLLLAGPPSLDERYRMERLEKGVEVAYANLGRRHTLFQPGLLRGTDAATADYLTRLVYLLDLMVVLRADAVKNLESGRPPSQYERVFPVVRGRLEDLLPPLPLVPAHRLVLQALDDQAAFFRAWARRPGTPLDVEDPGVRRSHRRIVQAYDLLLESLPQQETVVLEGLYDPLHAVDLLGYVP